MSDSHQHHHHGSATKEEGKHDCCQHDGDSHEPFGHHHAHEAAPALTAAPKARPGQWTCPMHPEVISNQPGDCPKCGMALEQVPILTGTIYTCPMHPQIEQDHPGDCPICGMALEPKGGSAEDEHAKREIRDLSRRFWIGTILTIPVLFLAMGGLIPGLHLHELVSKSVSKWIEFALATPVILWAGSIFFVKGWRSIVNRSLNMFTLIAIGVGAAYLFSAVAVLAPGLFPESFRKDGEVGLYFEAGAVITVLVLLGQLLEAKARNQTGQAIKALLNLAAKTAHRLRNGEEEEVPVDQLQPGDLVRVRPGEKFPSTGSSPRARATSMNP